VRITCPPLFWNFQSLQQLRLVRHSLYKVNRIGDKQHHCPTPLPVFLLLVSTWCIFLFTFWTMHNLLFCSLSAPIDSTYL
jgi:hypothetical protein